MADVVIVVGARRGREPVPVAEIRQMAGRAGRRHGGLACEAHVLVDAEDVSRMEDRLEGGDKFQVSSTLSSCDEMMFHLLPEICNGVVDSLSAADNWYNKSFAAVTGKKQDMRVVLEKLVECGAATALYEEVTGTEMGKISADLYLHPLDLRAWRDNFEELFEMGLEKDDAAVAWALGGVPGAEAVGDLGSHRHVFSMFRDALPSELESKPGTVVQSVLWWSALGGPSVGKMRNKVLELRSDFGRVSKALMRLNKIGDWGMDKFFVGLEARMKRGVPEHLSELCEIEGMSKGLASYLYDVGVKTRRDIGSRIEDLTEDMDEKSAAFLREVADVSN